MLEFQSEGHDSGLDLNLNFQSRNLRWAHFILVIFDFVLLCRFVDGPAMFPSQHDNLRPTEGIQNRYVVKFFQFPLNLMENCAVSNQ